MAARGSAYEPLPQDPAFADVRPAVASRRHVKQRMLGATFALVSLVALFAQQYGAQVETLANSLASPYGSTCPDPSRLRPPQSTHLSRSIDLPSLHSPFSVAVNYDPDACNAFEVSVVRRDPFVCTTTSTIEPSKDGELARHIKTNLGPDTLEIRLDGAERIAQQIPSRFDAETCSYHYSFRLINSGRVYLNITHLYADYRGYREDSPNIVDPFPGPPILQRVLDSDMPVELDLCPFCPTTVAPASLATSILPQCDKHTTPEGSYIPAALALQHTLYPHAYHLPMISGRPLAGLHDWIPQGCRWDHAGLRGRNHAPCLARPHHALLIGDSHTRVLSEAVAHRLQGENGMLGATVKLASRQKTIGSLVIDFVYDPFIRNTTFMRCDVLSQFDSILMTTGAHPLARDCESTSAWSATVETAMARISACKSEAALSRASGRPQRHIFLTTPTIQNHANRKTDCRTQPRVARWNEAAREAAAKRGWDVLDFYRLAAPLTMDSFLVDGTHYLKTDAIEPLVDQYLGMLGICDEVE